MAAKKITAKKKTTVKAPKSGAPKKLGRKTGAKRGS